MGQTFADGCDSYSGTSDLARNWAAVGSGWEWNASAGRFGGGAIRCVSPASQSLIASQYWSAGVTGGSLAGHAFWFKCSGKPGSNSPIFHNINSTGAQYTYLGVTPSGYLTVWGVNAWFGTGNKDICDDQWHWIEWREYATTALSYYPAWADGLLQFNTAAYLSQYDRYQSCPTGIPGLTVTFDDVIGLNDVSPSPRASEFPAGGKRITTLRPSGDSAVQFTRSAGSTNYSLVNEVSADEDSTYVEDSVSGHADEYDYDDMPYTPVLISSVQLVSRVKNPGGGSINFKQRCHSGGTTSDGSSFAAPGTYFNYRRILNQDPNTSAAWNKTNLDAAKFGITVV